MNNFTCNMPKHLGLWSILAVETFAPAYPTSIRGSNDQRGSPGTR